MAKIIIADNHSFYRRGLRLALEKSIPDLKVDETNSIEGALLLLEGKSRFDALLFEPGKGTVVLPTIVGTLLGRYQQCKFVILSSFDSADLVLDTLAAGLHGFISKKQSDEEVLAAVRDILSGRIYVPASIMHARGGAGNYPSTRTLTDGRTCHRTWLPRLTCRQHQVLVLIAHGLPNREIAQRLKIAEPTVKVHIAALMRTIGARNRTEAALLSEMWLAQPVLPSAHMSRSRGP